MNRIKKSILSCLLIAAVFLAALPLAAASAAEATVVHSLDELINTIEAIPAGGAGEITIEDVYAQLMEGIYFEDKDVTLNLVNSHISVAADPDGYSVPVVHGYGANITINADDFSGMSTFGHTCGFGVVRVDNSYIWDAETQSFEEEFTLTVNGGKYACVALDADSEMEPDYVFVASPGTNAVLTDVLCDGKVEAVSGETIGVPVYGDLEIHSGKFTNDVRQYAVKDAFCCQVGHHYYVRAQEFSEEFRKVAPDGKVIFPYAKPNAEEGASWLIMEEFCTTNENFSFDPFEDFSDDFATLELTLYPETGKEEVHAVEVVWDYSEDVLNTVNVFIEKFPEDRSWFHVTDLELVNYWLYNKSDAELESTTDSLANYSGELRAYLDNSNFQLPVETRGGSDDIFYTERIGSAKLVHEGTAYATFEMLGARAEHVIYVPADTDDTKEALAAEAQKRIDDYIGANRIKITAAEETVTDYYNTTIADFDAEMAAAQVIYDRESAKPENERDWDAYWNAKNVLDYTPGYKQYFIDSLEEDGDLHFLRQAAGDFFFNVQVKEGQDPYKFIIVKNDEKLAAPAYSIKDLNTKVQIKTDSPAVPLDTTVKVEKLTAGESYESILKTLNVDKDHSETFDIKLHSDSLGGYVTKLKDGKFEVTIPLSEKLKGQDLAAYYVDADGKTEIYEATPTDDKNYVVFYTDHFSIYTLAAASSNDGDTGTTENSGNSSNDSQPAQKGQKPISPATGDSTNLLLWIAIAFVSGGVVLRAGKKVSC